MSQPVRAAPLPRPCRRSGALAGAVALALAGCASGPPAPDWQLNAHGALDRAVAAYLAGDTRVADAEFERAQRELSRTGRADLLARAELARCASRTASLVVEECTAFEALRPDAAPPELAYADYLAGRVRPQDVALLPEQHRATAAALASATAFAPGAAGAADRTAATPLPDAAEPLARLVAAGALFRAGRASPALIASAIDTASAQGWRRPLLAWLTVQMEVARQGGDSATEALARRRLAIVLGPAASPRPASAADAANTANRP